ncbi:hypothetical protein [Cellulomonas chengniuliangii]|uniref:Uncharacterized protein n=1 Tax=Cellulomonas chengniuliangii TaxID=2968084 RepID=A0ABY5L4L6_9CELL|nr:hypothetical protein [Cellulomonas chengniuliangii]MCC2308228.1 hypothetical protein [Cellulomonas chengniuliangii]MCC2317235.1 hypothetical protein [Cellulomonas chengniuliangii]UUI76616.1 hypothetical protein NP064_06950 [Cellulomonas chengniuliangii]
MSARKSSAAVVLVAAAVAAVWAVRRRPAARGPAQRMVVTVYRSAEELDPLPAPLLDIPASLRVELTPAPGDRGTEVAVSGPDLAQTEVADTVRGLLREAKQIAETGEVLALGTPPHGRRKATPSGWAMDALVSRSRTKGVL